MNRVLLISGSFTSANFHVMMSILESISKNIMIHAISANNEDSLALPASDRIVYHHVYNWRKSFLNRLKRSNSLINRVVEFVFYRITSLYDNFFTSRYEREIYRRSKQIIEDESIDAIFSVCLRFYTHRLAIMLRRDYNLPTYQFWVDPFSNMTHGGGCLWRCSAEKVERQFFQNATIIYALPEVFIGNRVIRDYASKLRYFEIPYLTNRVVETRNKNIIFAGGFIKGVRDPRPVFEIIISALPEIESDVKFNFYVNGRDHYASYANRSKGRILFYEFVPHDELFKLLAESYMLLNIGNAGSIQMPSKTVEYVSFRKPLLFFYKDKNDASLRYLEDYPCICRINTEDSLEQNKNRLVSFINAGHDSITYEQLMQVDVFRRSTPEYIRTIIQEAQE